MNLKEALKKTITIHWWNYNKKTLDFKGTYEEYLRKRDILVTRRKDKLYFKIFVGCAVITLQVNHYTWPIDELDSAIKLFLTYMGDKTLFKGYSRTYRLNWN